MRDKILQDFYTAFISLERESGAVAHSYCNFPKSSQEILKYEDLELFFQKYYSKESSPLFDKISIDDTSYWVRREVRGEHLYYLIQECKRWDSLLTKAELNSTIDGLTQCYTKVQSETLIERELLVYLRYKKNPFSVIMFDIDFFKKVNDTYGHLAGDYILKELSSLVSSQLRESDFCGRFGGEEFLVTLPQTKLVGALNLAEKLRELCQNFHFTFNGEEIKITISLGVTSVGISDSVASIIDRCDTALYRAKNSGRNRVEYR